MSEIEIVKSVINEILGKANIPLSKIILFGSRARSDFAPDSDWDFLVIVKDNLANELRMRLLGSIRKRLAFHKIPNDIIIKSENIIDEQKNDRGYLTYYALRDGITV